MVVQSGKSGINWYFLGYKYLLDTYLKCYPPVYFVFDLD